MANPTDGDGGPALTGMTGPFETEQQAREVPAVQAIHAAFRADPGVGKMAPHILGMLAEACEDCGVALGRFDHRVLAWLSRWEPETAAVIAGMLGRAYESGRATGPAGPGGGWASGSMRP